MIETYGQAEFESVTEVLDTIEFSLNERYEQTQQVWDEIVNTFFLKFFEFSAGRDLHLPAKIGEFQRKSQSLFQEIVGPSRPLYLEKALKQQKDAFVANPRSSEF